MAGPSTTTSQDDAKSSKRVWSVHGSKFFEHMDEEVPGYGENAAIMYSLHHQKNYVQTGSNGKIQNCAHLFKDAAADDDSAAGPSKAAEVQTPRFDLLASPKRGSLAPAKTPSPIRRALSKLKSKLKVDTPRRSPYAESISESVHSRGGRAEPLAGQDFEAQTPRARKWSFSSGASGEQFKTASMKED